ncbi:PD-(D/E)XK nuclease family transposase [Wolbachia endosymbiont of Cylisticus convexus]|uniref:hypothetical protein n=1 Tax=Wolbachia endosymbiont of Cylisticus convexus TaxID=118728 RepID=UPI000DF700CE|nr:hypothetical protein [Wolbachia endosymbiont of Cylisticus convexus]RDD34567.1 PD-(D/E)XK nuclease family transposase [Wolbachia endosymbiont of Cylisticus convexus]
MINVNPSKEFEMPEYLKEAVAGSREKDLRWLEPYEGKLSSTVPRGEFSGKYLSPLNSYSFIDNTKFLKKIQGYPSQEFTSTNVNIAKAGIKVVCSG